jgi:hypothetical protein
MGSVLSKLYGSTQSDMMDDRLSYARTTSDEEFKIQVEEETLDEN